MSAPDPGSAPDSAFARDEEAGQDITVEVAYARPDSQRIVALQVEAGTTLIEAVERSRIVDSYAEIDLAAASFGVFGKVEKQRDRVLRDGDRVEIYRPLLIDPKAKRAKRAKDQAQAAPKAGG